MSKTTLTLLFAIIFIVLSAWLVHWVGGGNGSSTSSDVATLPDLNHQPPEKISSSMLINPWTLGSGTREVARTDQCDGGISTQNGRCFKASSDPSATNVSMPHNQWGGTVAMVRNPANPNEMLIKHSASIPIADCVAMLSQLDHGISGVSVNGVAQRLPLDTAGATSACNHNANSVVLTAPSIKLPR